MPILDRRVVVIDVFYSLTYPTLIIYYEEIANLLYHGG